MIKFTANIVSYLSRTHTRLSIATKMQDCHFSYWNEWSKSTQPQLSQVQRPLKKPTDCCCIAMPHTFQNHAALNFYHLFASLAVSALVWGHFESPFVLVCLFVAPILLCVQWLTGKQKNIHSTYKMRVDLRSSRRMTPIIAFNAFQPEIWTNENEPMPSRMLCYYRSVLNSI